MNFRILAAPVWPRGRVLALLAATTLTAALIAPDARAQTPAPAPGAPPAAPKAAPAAPAPAAQAAPPAAAPAAPGAPPADQQIQLIYAPWTKFCLKGQDANAK